MQPLSRKPDQPRSEDWTIIYNHVDTTLQSFRNVRWPFWAYWEVLHRFFSPRRNKWVITPNRWDKGQPVNDAIKDSTGLQAVRTCAGGMWTGLTSPSRPWLKVVKGLPWLQLDADGAAWLKDKQDRILTVLDQSNFYDIFAQAFNDEVVSGNAPIIVYEDDEDVINLRLPCTGEYFQDMSSRLTVDRLYREFTYNVIQIVGMFKVENCPIEVVNMWRQGGAALQREFVVCHAIEPNFPISKRTGSADEDDRVFVVPDIFAWREVYWLRGIKGSGPLSIRGFRTKPFGVLGWKQVSNDPYYHGPCEDCLGDNKQVQLETLNKAKFIGKGVDPPMLADPALKEAQASIIQGQITYASTANGNAGFKPIYELNPQWLPALTADIEQVNKRIQSCLYVDLFMAISRMEGVQPRNELELSKRDLERLQELGPVIRQNERAISDIIIRIDDIMTRRRMFRPMPKSLEGVPIGIKYTSIMRIAQRSAESVAMKDLFQVAGALSSAAKAAEVPDPIRILNLDKALRLYGELNEAPDSIFFTEGEVVQHDQIRHQATQAAAAPGAAMAGVTAAKTLADTSLAPGSALSAMVGGGGGQ